MKKTLKRIVKITGITLLVLIAIPITIGLIYSDESDYNSATTASNGIEEQQKEETEKPKNEEKESEEKVEKENPKKPEEESKQEETHSKEGKEALEWLTSIGAFDSGLSKDWSNDKELISFYNSIREDMKYWDAENDFESLREHLKGFDLNHTSEEIDNMTDYQVYVESKNLRESMIVDAEEPDWDDYSVFEVNNADELKNIMRDQSNINSTIKFSGEVIGTNSGEVYSYAINCYHDTLVYISNPGFDLFLGDELIITAVYRGKNNTGQVCFESVSVEVQ